LARSKNSLTPHNHKHRIAISLQCSLVSPKNQSLMKLSCNNQIRLSGKKGSLKEIFLHVFLDKKYPTDYCCWVFLNYFLALWPGKQ